MHGSAHALHVLCFAVLGHRCGRGHPPECASVPDDQGDDGSAWARPDRTPDMATDSVAARAARFGCASDESPPDAGASWNACYSHSLRGARGMQWRGEDSERPRGTDDYRYFRRVEPFGPSERAGAIETTASSRSRNCHAGTRQKTAAKKRRSLEGHDSSCPFEITPHYRKEEKHGPKDP